jgi:hypothetical protein
MHQHFAGDEAQQRRAGMMMTGYFSITVISNWLPKMISGIDRPRPMISSSVRAPGGPLSAAAATAMTLSRLITRSAIRIVRIAPHKWLDDLMPSSPPSSGNSSCTPIQNSSTAPMIFRYG